MSAVTRERQSPCGTWRNHWISRVARRVLMGLVMMKSSLTVILLASIGLFTPAIAGKIRPSVAKGKAALLVGAKDKKPNLGESYDLFARSSKPPTANIDSDEIAYDLRPVTQGQIS